MVNAALLDALASLASYPRGGLSARLAACAELSRACEPQKTDVTAALDRFAAAIGGLSLGELQQDYARTFDFTPSCTLDLGWHLYGDAYERGPFMAGLVDALDRLGIPESTELPDHLTNLLALIGREQPHAAAALAEIVVLALERVRLAVAKSGSPYAHLLEAIESQVSASTGCVASGRG